MTQFLDKSGLEYYTNIVKQGMSGKVDKSEEPNVLYGVDSHGTQNTFAMGENIRLEDTVLPEGYTEVEYIKNVADEVEVGDIEMAVTSVSITNELYLISKFNQADDTTGATKTDTLKIVFEEETDSTRWFNVYAVEDGTEYLFAEHGSDTAIKASFGINFVQIGNIYQGDYMEFKRTSWNGKQYIDTGVVFCDDYEYNEEQSMHVQGVNVDISGLTSYYMYSNISYEYLDLVFYNDGTSDVVGRVPQGQLYPVAVSGLDYLESSFGIVITGDVIYGSSVETRDGTVVRITRTPYSGKIETEFKVEKVVDNGIYPITAYSQTGNFGVGLHGSKGGYSFCSWSYSTYQTGFSVNTEWTKAYVTSNREKYIAVKMGDETVSSTAQYAYFPGSLTLFARHKEEQYGEFDYSATPICMKRTKVYKNSVLSFDGVPCIRESDGAIGMYDLVSGTFQDSHSDTPFVAGEEVKYPLISAGAEKILSTDTAEIVRGFENDEYVQLEWLQGRGKSVINLGITYNNYNYIYEVKFKMDTSDNTSRGIFGNHATTINSRPGCALRVGGYSPSIYANLVWNNSPLATSTDIACMDYQWHTYKVSSYAVVIDGSSQFQHSTQNYGNYAKMALFGTYQGMGNPETWQPVPQFIGKIAYFNVYYRNSQYQELLTNQFVPVRRKADDALGFYDVLNGTFHPNLGTEDFIPGEELGVRVQSSPDSNVFTTVSSSTLSGNTLDSHIQALSKLNGNHNTAYGVETRVNYGGENTVIGYRAENGNGANQGSSTVVGAQSTDSYGFGTVIGAKSSSTKNCGTVVGSGSTASGTGAIVVGHNSRANGEYAINIGCFKANQGSDYYTSGNYAVAIGYGTKANQTEAVVIGKDSKVTSDHGTALGSLTSAGNYATAVGHGSTASTFGVAIGVNNASSTIGQYAVGIGYNVSAADYSVAIGNSAAAQSGSIAIGKASVQYSADAICIGSSASMTSVANSGGVAIGRNVNCGSYGVSLGYNTTNQNGSYSVAIGNSAISQGSYNVAIGPDARTEKSGESSPVVNYSTALGYGAQVTANKAIQLGWGVNSEESTMYVGLNDNNYKLLNSDGIIPYERITTDPPENGEFLKYNSSTNSLEFGEGGGGGGTDPYVLPAATATRLGGVKVGNGLAVKADGTLSVEGGGGSGEGYGASFDGGSAYSVYLLSQTIEGGSADSKYTSSQIINGGRANG